MTIEWLLTDAALAIGLALYLYGVYDDSLVGMMWGCLLIFGGIVSAGFLGGAFN